MRTENSRPTQIRTFKHIQKKIRIIVHIYVNYMNGGPFALYLKTFLLY